MAKYIELSPTVSIMMKGQRQEYRRSRFVRLADDSILMKLRGSAKELGLLLQAMFRFPDQWNVEIEETSFMTRLFNASRESGEYSWSRSTFDRAVKVLKSSNILLRTENSRWVFNPNGIVKEGIQYLSNLAKKHFGSPKKISGKCETGLSEKEVLTEEMPTGTIVTEDTTKSSMNSVNYQVVTDDIVEDVVELTFEAIPTDEVESMDLMDVINLHPMITMEILKNIYGAEGVNELRNYRNGTRLMTYVWFYQTFGHKLNLEEVGLLTKELAEDWLSTPGIKEFIRQFSITKALTEEHQYWETLQYNAHHKCFLTETDDALKGLSAEAYVLQHGYHRNSKLNSYSYNQHLTEEMAASRLGKVFLEKFQVW